MQEHRSCPIQCYESVGGVDFIIYCPFCSWCRNRSIWERVYKCYCRVVGNSTNNRSITTPFSYFISIDFSPYHGWVCTHRDPRYTHNLISSCSGYRYGITCSSFSYCTVESYPIIVLSYLQRSTSCWRKSKTTSQYRSRDSR